MKYGTKPMSVGSIDIVIAAMVLNKDLPLVTMDKDFRFIQSVRPRLEPRIIESESQ